MEENIRVGISHGDFNGIGYEVILKTFSDVRMFERITPIIYGSLKVASYHKKNLGLENVVLTGIRKAEEANYKKLNIITCIDENIRVEMGKLSSSAGLAAFNALERSVADLKDGKIDVLVTAPINKQSIQSNSFQFPGHTEYLAEKLGSKEYLMLMVSEEMRIGMVTCHTPLSSVPGLITMDSIIQKIKIFHQSLIYDFGIRRPRIAVLSLNPHAGDNGLLGKEELEIIQPAIKAAVEEKLIVLGPYGADGFFGSSHYRKFDGILAMFHDQALIPFKAISMEKGVNFTAALPFVRTSPAHGTAYEIAGKNQASHLSFTEAVFTACDIFEKRKMHKEITANPLPHVEV